MTQNQRQTKYHQRSLCFELVTIGGSVSQHFSTHKCNGLTRSVYLLKMLRATRAWALSSGAARTVACGASFSPAALGGRTGRSIQCVWNCGAPGTWDHCCWECPHRPVVIPKPQFAIVARFGWFLEHTFPNPELHRWLVRVQTIFWDLHHGRD